MYVFLKSVQFQNSVAGNEDLLVKHPHVFLRKIFGANKYSGGEKVRGS